MTTLTDRYVHAVAAQLPDSQREDIARELRATIEDTVAAAPPGSDPAQAERQALLDLGHPVTLADSYRGEGRSLIGPRFYPAWLRTLRTLLWVVPPMAAVLLLVIEALDGGSALDVVGGALSAAFWAAVQVTFWVTVGFVIAERTGAEVEGLDTLTLGSTSDWAPEDLPEPRHRQVSWGDAIGSVVSNALLLVLLVLPGRIGGRVEGLEWGQIFTDSAYSLRWVLAAGVAVSLVASVYVLARGLWTWPTALVNLLGGLLFTVPVVWLASRNDLVAWDTLPLGWIGDGDLRVNEGLTLSVTVAVLVVIVVWETVDSFRKAARSR